MKLKAMCIAMMSIQAMVGAVEATAYEKGDWIIRLGAATVDPDASSSDVDLNDSSLDPVLNSGTGVDVESDTQLGITGTYMFANNWGVSLLAATPFKHEIEARGMTGLGISDIGDAKQLPPTITVQYYFDVDERIKPYVGLGVNYTTFFDEDVSSDVVAGLHTAGSALMDNPNALVINDVEMELDDSIGLAAQIGVDVLLTDHWALNAQVWWIDIDTEATLKTDTGSRLDVDVDVDPWVYMLGVAYRF